MYLKKKGIGEYADLTKTFRVNLNKEFTQKINSNPYRFRKYKGIFSDMYDSSHKNGDIITPFGKSKKKNKHTFLPSLKCWFSPKIQGAVEKGKL